ncbi:AAA family ATPase [Mycolicibacterium elephantis]
MRQEVTAMVADSAHTGSGLRLVNPEPNAWRIVGSNNGAHGQQDDDEYVTIEEALGEAQPETLPWDRYPLVSARTLARPIKPARWLVEGTWIEKSAGVVAGKKKAFKTWQMHSMALAVTSGKPFLDDFQVVTPGPVVYLTGEGGQDEFQSRHQAIARRYGFDGGNMGDLPFHVMFHVAALDDDEFLSAVKHHLDTVQPVAVYIDPLYAYHPHDVDVSSVYSRGQMLATIRQQVEPYAALIIGDHLNKSANDTRLDLDDIGFSGMSQWADSWSLQRHREPFRSAGPDSWAKLEVEFGTRRSGSLRYDVDWHLVRDLRDHRVIKWESCDWEIVQRIDTSKPVKVSRTVTDEDVRKAVLQFISEGLESVASGGDSGFYTETQILKGVAAQSQIPRSRVAAVLAEMIEGKALEKHTDRRVGRDGKKRNVTTWVPADA